MDELIINHLREYYNAEDIEIIRNDTYNIMGHADYEYSHEGDVIRPISEYTKYFSSPFYFIRVFAEIKRNGKISFVEYIGFFDGNDKIYDKEYKILLDNMDGLIDIQLDSYRRIGDRFNEPFVAAASFIKGNEIYTYNFYNSFIKTTSFDGAFFKYLW